MQKKVRDGKERRTFRTGSSEENSFVMQALRGNGGSGRQSCLTRGHAAIIMNRSDADGEKKAGRMEEEVAGSAPSRDAATSLSRGCNCACA